MVCSASAASTLALKKPSSVPLRTGLPRNSPIRCSRRASPRKTKNTGDAPIHGMLGKQLADRGAPIRIVDAQDRGLLEIRLGRTAQGGGDQNIEQAVGRNGVAVTTHRLARHHPLHEVRYRRRPRPQDRHPRSAARSPLCRTSAALPSGSKHHARVRRRGAGDENHGPQLDDIPSKGHARSEKSRDRANCGPRPRLAVWRQPTTGKGSGQIILRTRSNSDQNAKRASQWRDVGDPHHGTASSRAAIFEATLHRL